MEHWEWNTTSENQNFPFKRGDFLYTSDMSVNPLIYEETFYVATKLCLKCGDEILTLVESYPWLPLWRELPGGKISKADGSNSPLFTLNREIREELGIDIQFDDSNTGLFHVEKRYEVTTQYTERAFIFLCYLYEIDSKPELILTEHSEALWIRESDIDSYTDWRPGFDSIIRRAFLYNS